MIKKYIDFINENSSVDIDLLEEDVNYIMQSLLDDYKNLNLELLKVSTVFDENNEFKLRNSFRYKSDNYVMGKQYPPIQFKLTTMGPKNVVLVDILNTGGSNIYNFLKDKSTTIVDMGIKYKYLNHGNGCILFWYNTNPIKESIEFDWVGFESIVSDFMQPLVDDSICTIKYRKSDYNTHTEILHKAYNYGNCILAYCTKSKGKSMVELGADVVEYITSKKDLQSVYDMSIKILPPSSNDFGVCVLFFPNKLNVIK